MKNLIYFFAGIILVTLVSATTVSVMTIKPQLPKSTIYIVNATSNEVNSWIRKGYIIKCISNERYSIAVVLEKY